MRAEILSIGTELLLGQITDTNAAYVSRDLAGRGIDVLFRDTVGDNFERLVETYRMALKRADLVITIGGLGPTEDDITKETAAAVTGIDLVNDPESEATLRDFFAMRGIKFSDNNLKQALKPSKGVNLLNPNGTAPGCVFDLDDKAIICLPGPPREFEPMWQNQAVPWLIRRGFTPHEVIRSRMLRFVGIGESSLEPLVKDLLRGKNPTVAPYAKTGEVHLRVSAKAADEATAIRMIEQKEAEIRERAGNYLYGKDNETLETIVVRECIKAGVKIATAESCTGGLIASRITDVAGSSETFLEGLICYANNAKIKLLGVPMEMIAVHGAVSPEVAKAMARGALERSGADIAVSDTGIAGPGGGSDEKPVGLVYIGLATRNGVRSEKHLFIGDRQTVKLRASQSALVALRTALCELRKPN